MKILLLCLLLLSPPEYSIYRLPMDYAGDKEVRQETIDHFLFGAAGDPKRAAEKWFNYMVWYYTKPENRPDESIPQVLRTYQQMLRK